MALWVVRAGTNGEYERKFLDESRIYLTWENLNYDLSKPTNRAELKTLLEKAYPNTKSARLRNWIGQVWPFAKEIKAGDWVACPSRLKRSAIHFAEITGGYQYDPTAEDPYHHYHSVKWFATDIPRSVFDQDILYSFGALQTVYGIMRNNAEARLRALAQSRWGEIPAKTTPTADEKESSVNLEDLARDQIAKAIIRKYKGHGMARLVEAILKAQGYTTYLSPEGPDKGIDILAALGPLGFGTPQICVQVKSSSTPVDSPTLNQLIGSMQNVQAKQGLLVSWGGFKSSIDKEVPTQFFRVRLWDQAALIDALLANYDKLDETLRAELPFKRIWVAATPEEDEMG